MNILEMKEASYSSTNNLNLIHPVDLVIQEGTITEFHGPSGGGKSTMLKMLAGIIAPTTGKVFFKDKCIAEMNRQEDLAFRKQCAFVFQNSALWSNQTILQNLLLPMQIHFPKLTDKERRGRIKEMCRKTGYTKELSVRPADLSAGEQKIIAVTRSLLIEPELLFLDECTLSLDDKSAGNIIRLLHDFIDKGKTMIYISHNEMFRYEFPGDMYEVSEGNCEYQEYDIEDFR